MELPTSDLSSLMKFIADGHPFNGNNYPGFDELEADQQELFIVSHSVLHMNKSLGRIAAEAENAGHGDSMEHDKLIVATTKMVINSLRLAEALGLTADDIVRRIPELMKPQ